MPMPLKWSWPFSYALVAGLWIWSYRVWPTLPDAIPAHIGTNGVSGWQATTPLSWFLLPLIALGSTALIHAATWLSTRNPRWVNLPQKDKLLALPPEGQQAVLGKIRDALGLAAMLTAFIMVMSQQMRWRVALGDDSPAPAIAIIVAAVLIGPIITVVLLVSVQRELDRQFSKTASG